MGFFRTISKVQILIIGKQLTTCHHETTSFIDGRLIKSRFEVSRGKFVLFIPVYGIPHSPNNRNYASQDNTSEIEMIVKMNLVKQQLQKISRKQ
jgi:hypothetical protein